jgi:RNA polymerase sigma-32 factor
MSKDLQDDLLPTVKETELSYHDDYSENQILNKYIREISKFPMLTAEQERELLDDYFENSNPEAGKMIIVSHLRLVVRIAMQYKNYGLNMMDIIAEGNTGLVYALKKFDVKQQNRFSTYAMLWVKANIQDFILKSWSLVKVGSVALRKTLLFNMKNVKREIGILETESKEVQNEKIAKHLNMDVKDFNEVQSMLFNKEASLNAPVFSDDNASASLQDTIASSDNNFVAEITEEEDHKIKMQALKVALSHLDKREKDIIFARYISEEKATLEDLSIKFGISRERVRQIEANAIKKMQNSVKIKEGK